MSFKSTLTGKVYESYGAWKDAEYNAPDPEYSNWDAVGPFMSMMGIPSFAKVKDMAVNASKIAFGLSKETSVWSAVADEALYQKDKLVGESKLTEQMPVRVNEQGYPYNLQSRVSIHLDPKVVSLNANGSYSLSGVLGPPSATAPTPPAPSGGRIGDPGLPESGVDAYGSYTRTKNGLRDYGDGTYGVGSRSFTKKGRETAESRARNASNPIALDLDGNGTVDLVDLSASTAFYDLNGDGYRTHLGWVGPADGFLAYDKNGDGIIQEGDELSFTTFVNAALGEAQALSLYDRNLDGVLTDLESLAHFDVNKDGALNAGILNTNDTPEWGKFGVWQDLDQDGVSDAGEFKSLAAWNITSFNLSSDGVGQDIGDNHSYGTGSFELTGGVSREFLDAALATSDIGFRTSADGTFEFQMSQGNAFGIPANDNRGALTARFVPARAEAA